MSKQLEEIRKKIDTLDHKIHDLLMQRADLIIDVAKAKKKANIQVVQPAREAEMIRRLLKRHQGPLPEAAIVRIWRELVGAVSLLQTGLKISVSMPEDGMFCWDLAKDYFGSVLPMEKSSTSLTAVSAVRENKVSFAVVPWPNDNDENPWWVYLLSQEQERMRIVCALPYGSAGDFLSIHDKAMVVSKTDFLPSGEDHSFLYLETDHSVSRARIFDVLKALGLEPLGINTKRGVIEGGHSLHLVEVNDYIAENDPRLQQITEKFEEFNTICKCVGGYPVPPVYQAQNQFEPDKQKTGT